MVRIQSHPFQRREFPPPKFTPQENPKHQYPMNNPKNKTSVRQSAVFNARALLGLGFGTLGLLLGLAAFIALPKHSALATPSPCTPVVYSESPSQYVRDAIDVTMESHNAGTTTQCTIYYTVGATNPPNPTHFSAIYTAPYVVLHGDAKFCKAFGHALYADPEDSEITGHY